MAFRFRQLLMLALLAVVCLVSYFSGRVWRNGTLSFAPAKTKVVVEEVHVAVPCPSPPAVATAAAPPAVAMTAATTGTTEEVAHALSGPPPTQVWFPRANITRPRLRSSAHMCHSRDYADMGNKHASCLFRQICAVANDNNKPSRMVEWIYITDKPVDEDEISFSMGIGPHSVDNRVFYKPTQITSADFHTKYPKTRQINTITASFHEYNAENFGHMMMDVLLPIYTGLDGFDELTPDVQMLRMQIKPLQDNIGWSCDYQIATFPEARAAKVKRNCERFYTSMSPMVSKYPLKLLSSVVNSSTEPVCWDKIVLGMSMFSDDCMEGEHGRNQEKWSLCNHARQRQFWSFRGYTMANLGIVDRPPKEHHIIISAKGGRARHIHGLEDFAVRLRQKYKVKVSVMDWEKMSMKEQLTVASTATVHITQPGGVSFLGVYLPRGATTIRLYTREFRMEFHIFHYLGYIHSEHVNCPNGKMDAERVDTMVGDSLKRYDAFGVPFPEKSDK